MLCAQIFQKKTPFFLVITLLLLYSGVSPGKFEKKKTYLEKKYFTKNGHAVRFPRWD